MQEFLQQNLARNCLHPLFRRVPPSLLSLGPAFSHHRDVKAASVQLVPDTKPRGTSCLALQKPCPRRAQPTLFRCSCASSDFRRKKGLWSGKPWIRRCLCLQSGKPWREREEQGTLAGSLFCSRRLRAQVIYLTWNQNLRQPSYSYSLDTYGRNFRNLQMFQQLTFHQKNGQHMILERSQTIVIILDKLLLKISRGFALACPPPNPDEALPA